MYEEEMGSSQHHSRSALPAGLLLLLLLHRKVKYLRSAFLALLSSSAGRNKKKTRRQERKLLCVHISSYAGIVLLPIPPRPIFSFHREQFLPRGRKIIELAVFVFVVVVQSYRRTQLAVKVFREIRGTNPICRLAQLSRRILVPLAS